MMSGSGWFNRAAHSLLLVRYSHIIRPPYRRRPHIPRRFHQLILPPCLLGFSLPHRHHSSSPHVIIAITRPARRLVRAGSMTGRCHPYRVVRSLLASKQAGGAWPCVRHSRLTAGVALASSSMPGTSKQATAAMSSMSSMSSMRVRSSSTGVSSNRNERAGRRHPCHEASKQAGACSRGMCGTVPSLPV